MYKIDVGEDFHHRLTNRDKHQRDGKYTGLEFREKYLSELYNSEVWENDIPFIELDFSNVTKLGPSWANEVFAFFTQYAKPKRILSKIKLKNISKVKKAIIEEELAAGYLRK